MFYCVFVRIVFKSFYKVVYINFTIISHKTALERYLWSVLEGVDLESMDSRVDGVPSPELRFFFVPASTAVEGLVDNSEVRVDEEK